MELEPVYSLHKMHLWLNLMNPTKSPMKVCPMCTLYLNTPKAKEEMGSTPFEKTEATGIGVRFYIHQTSLPKLFNGMPVVVVRRDGKKKSGPGPREH